MLDLSPSFATFPTLETERFILRAVRRSDVHDLMVLLSDDRVTRYLSHGSLKTIEEIEARITRYETFYAEEKAINWMIATRETDQLIGNCVLFSFLPQHHRAELGYMLRPDWWRKGVVKEAASAVIGYAFNTMGLHSLEGRIDPDNVASAGMLTKLGFVQEAYFKENFYEEEEQRFGDTAVYSLLEQNWSPVS